MNRLKTYKDLIHHWPSREAPEEELRSHFHKFEKIATDEERERVDEFVLSRQAQGETLDDTTRELLVAYEVLLSLGYDYLRSIGYSEEQAKSIFHAPEVEVQQSGSPT